MKKYRWEIRLGAFFAALSTAFYFWDYIIFKDTKYIFNDILMQLGFLPIYVFLSTIFLGNLLSRRDKRLRIRKLNMIIGVFFSEFGVELIEYISEYDKNFNALRCKMILTKNCCEKNIIDIRKVIKNHNFDVDSRNAKLNELMSFLQENKSFILELMQNPNLIEHESFTELLWAVFHLIDELQRRKDLSQLSEDDYKHLSGDIKRVYTTLVFEWTVYIKHLLNEYPYIFSLAVESSPFNSDECKSQYRSID